VVRGGLPLASGLWLLASALPSGAQVVHDGQLWFSVALVERQPLVELPADRRAQDELVEAREAVAEARVRGGLPLASGLWLLASALPSGAQVVHDGQLWFNATIFGRAGWIRPGRSPGRATAARRASSRSPGAG
jgi:hypothetical protein